MTMRMKEAAHEPVALARAAHEQARALGFASAWSLPIKASDGRVLGTFGTYFRECREPTPQECEAVSVLATVAAEVLGT
jgi:GAF domain-containing protein